VKDEVKKNTPELVLVDKKTLMNPVKSWQDSPQHPVTLKATKQKGNLVGWEMLKDNPKLNYIDRTGKLLVHISSGAGGSYAAFAPSDLEPDTQITNAPWSHPEVKVWRSQHVAKIFSEIFAMKVEGMDVTFRQVFDIMLKDAVCVFVVGGAIRDCIIGTNV
jgi:hypothetical protein